MCQLCHLLVLNSAPVVVPLQVDSGGSLRAAGKVNLDRVADVIDVSTEARDGLSVGDVEHAGGCDIVGLLRSGGPDCDGHDGAGGCRWAGVVTANSNEGIGY